MGSDTLARQQAVLDSCYAALDDGGRLSRVAERALRLARLRADYLNEWWLRLELVGFDEENARKELDAEMIGHLGPEDFSIVRVAVMTDYMERRKVGTRDLSADEDKRNIATHSLGSMETLIASMRDQIEAFKPPPGMHAVDLYFKQQAYEKGAAQIHGAISEIEVVQERVRQRIVRYLQEVESQLLLGRVAGDAFERVRRRVDGELSRLAPDVLLRFRSAYERAAQADDAEARSHALTSCRRIIQALADALYPATGQTIRGADGKARAMTQDQFKNRLWQFASERVKPTHARQLLLANLEELVRRLESLNDLSSKGVHADVTAAEVDQCVMQTYLLCGDFLGLSEAHSE